MPSIHGTCLFFLWVCLIEQWYSVKLCCSKYALKLQVRLRHGKLLRSGINSDIKTARLSGLAWSTLDVKSVTHDLTYIMYLSSSHEKVDERAEVPAFAKGS